MKAFKDGTPLTDEDLNGLLAISVIPCTSTTRPTPAIGMNIYETDTGSRLVYSSINEGWAPPWNLPWGYVTHAESTGTVNIPVWATSETVSSVVALETPEFTMRQNRRYVARFRLDLMNLAVAGDLIIKTKLMVAIAGVRQVSTGRSTMSRHGWYAGWVAGTTATMSWTHLGLTTTQATLVVRACDWNRNAATSPTWQHSANDYGYGVTVEDLGSVGPPA
jgi:hypothetical protein